MSALPTAITRCRVDADRRAVRALDLLGPVDRRRSLHELGRVDQVAGAARVDHQPGPRQVLHQQAGAAGVVEVDMGRDDQIDRIDRQAQARQGRHQVRHRVVGPGVDEGGAAVLDDQVGGVEVRPEEGGVDDVDAVRQALDSVAGSGSVRRGEHRGDSRQAAPACGRPDASAGSLGRGECSEGGGDSAGARRCRQDRSAGRG